MAEVPGHAGVSMNEVIGGARVVVCVGPGGVGKTSTSAAIGIHAAREGRRTIVLTIDPARRLANALGLPEIGNEEREIGGAAFDAAGLERPDGVLTAMMLDIKSAWNSVVNRYHPDPEARERLLNNRLYQTLSTALAGSQEYMAMEKLYELSTRREDPLDLIVLDTPPSASAVDFLEAPSRMLDALDNEGTRWLLEPYTARGKVTQKLFDAGSSFFIRTIGRFTGIEVLQELAELLSGFTAMFEGFRQRARAVRMLLGDEGTTFVIVSAPRPDQIADARGFYDRLVADEIQVGAIVLNRARIDPFGGEEIPSPDVFAELLTEAGGSSDLLRRLMETAAQARAIAQHEASAARELAAAAGAVPVVTIPELPRDVHDLLSLRDLGAHLFRRDAIVPPSV